MGEKPRNGSVRRLGFNIDSIDSEIDEPNANLLGRGNLKKTSHRSKCRFRHGPFIRQLASSRRSLLSRDSFSHRRKTHRPQLIIAAVYGRTLVGHLTCIRSICSGISHVS
jgi:hypothetical protein